MGCGIRNRRLGRFVRGVDYSNAKEHVERLRDLQDTDNCARYARSKLQIDDRGFSGIAGLAQVIHYLRTDADIAYTVQEVTPLDRRCTANVRLTSPGLPPMTVHVDSYTEGLAFKVEDSMPDRLKNALEKVVEKVYLSQN